jgi:hypothetical protein
VRKSKRRGRKKLPVVLSLCFVVFVCEFCLQQGTTLNSPWNILGPYLGSVKLKPLEPTSPAVLL